MDGAFSHLILVSMTGYYLLLKRYSVQHQIYSYFLGV